ncbi:ABC transporter ATP-binding protein [Fictibacillus phosphorivorans]|uniref:ABC transporter ATP-binding protein n=1 Tax=Fictibacillus phosphorivorans TaxID=1221500 RepID=UPI00203BFD1C|nr:ATP-binding cassette domain-containing protein [Fictibacillus phosphorivorans]MCM3719516.1 ATP-binding cassette domain-containing protein [Fictibacillus phosphorivorans]MCM3777207.1 ATP-binding cassette domain-containing protein [Fictibacillus phosphorivorans]
MDKLLVRAQNLSKYFTDSTGVHKAVDGVSLNIHRGETLGVVGESGSGKTTLGRTLMRLYKPEHGQIWFDGKEITKLNDNKLRPYRREIQMIFQNPYESLSPRLTVGEILEEPLYIQKIGTKKERMDRALSMLEKVGLSRNSYRRKIHEFSGGQRQRIGIARALMLEPKFVIADEPVSALDVSVQAQVLNLLKDLQVEMNLTCLFISHDLSVVHYMSDRVAVMYLGHLIELAPKEELYRNPIHPYTKSLLSSIPVPDPDRRNPYREPINLPEKPLYPPQLVHVGNEHYVSANMIQIKDFAIKSTERQVSYI